MSQSPYVRVDIATPAAGAELAWVNNTGQWISPICFRTGLLPGAGVANRYLGFKVVDVAGTNIITNNAPGPALTASSGYCDFRMLFGGGGPSFIVVGVQGVLYSPNIGVAPGETLSTLTFAIAAADQYTTIDGFGGHLLYRSLPNGP